MVSNNYKYQVTVGIECHVQLATKSKLFSGADNDAREKSPNTVVSPIDYGLPGMLPVLNKEAIHMAIKAGIALNADISKISRFDRKHYFYPDLPKGYQISQMYQPIIGRGSVTVPQPDGTEKIVRIHHAHLEEDAGKLTHHAEFTSIDLNRAGTPLIEIVSEPDMHSAEEAKSYAQELYKLMTYSGVTLGDLYHGNMRFDVNISVATKTSSELGKRAEIKNINSFRSVERAVEFEFNRQVEILERGDSVKQETRGWDENNQKTFSQRSKEEAQDYRYMPDPDIPPIIITEELVEEITKSLPNLPNYYRNSWYSLDLDSTVVNALLSRQKSATLLENIKNKSNNDIAKKAANWLTTIEDQNEVNPSVNSPIEINEDHVIDLAELVITNKVSATAAKQIFREMIKSSQSPKEIAEKKSLFLITDNNQIKQIIDEIMENENNRSAIEDIKTGNLKAIGFLVGQAMKLSKGSANPSQIQEILIERINKL